MKRILLGCCLMISASSWAPGQNTDAARQPMHQSRQYNPVAPAAMEGPRFTAQIMGGLYLSSGLGPGAPYGSTVDPDFDYAPLSLRLGYLLGPPSDGKFRLRGTTEVLLELMAAPVTKGYANIVAGPSALVRYNFVQPNASLVPYIQAGGGIVYSDAYKTEGQDALGEEIEFLLQAQVGLRWMLSQKWSLDFEVGIQHISNAGLADRNGGINNLGGSVGFTYYLPELAR